MRPDMNGAFDAFDEMVEALEEQEDMVECKECFDLFPKVDCMKYEQGYICPTCNRALTQEPEIDSRMITTDLYSQDFPDIQDYDPGTYRDYSKELTVGDALDNLLKDEYEAIDGYEVANEVVQQSAASEDDKDKLLDTLDHIKEEEEEHIDELKELIEPEAEDSESKDDKKSEGEDKKDKEEDEDKDEEDDELEEFLDANVNLSLDGGRGNDVSVLSSHEPEATGSEKLDEAVGDLYTAEDLETGEIIAACHAASEDEATRILTQEFTEKTGKTGSDLEDCFITLAKDEDTVDAELLTEAVLTEANFLTNLFTKENQNLDAFFGKYKVNVGNSTIKTLLKWADAEKLAAQKSKATPNDIVSVSALSKDADDLKNQGWSSQFVKEFGGKDILIANYSGGKVTFVDKAAALAKRLKAEIKANKIMSKHGISSSEYNDQYNRNSISEPLKPSKADPNAVTIKKLANILFGKYTAIQGMAHPASEEAKETGSDIQIAEVKSLGEFATLADAATTAAGKSSRTPEEGSGDVPVVEIYGYFNDTFKDETLEYLEKYLTRTQLGALEEAGSAGGPVHLFTYSMGNVVEDNGCASLTKLIKYEQNIIEDLKEAGYEVSDKPGATKPKEENEEPTEDGGEDEEDLDMDVDILDEDDIDELKKSALEAFGEKLGAEGYTSESYEAYSKKFDAAVKFINKQTNVEELKKYDFAKLKAKYEQLLEEEIDIPEESEEETEPVESESTPKGKVSELTDIQLAKFFSAISGKEIGYADAEKTKLSDKWHKAMNKIRGKLKGLGESFGTDDELIEKLKQAIKESEDYYDDEDEVECTWCHETFPKSECRYEVDLEWLCSRCEMAIKSRGETLTFREGSYWDFLDEDLPTGTEAKAQLKDTAAALTNAAKNLKDMTNAMHEEYHKYANPEELKAMEALEAVIESAKTNTLQTLKDCGFEIAETDAQGWLSGNNEYSYQITVECKDVLPEEAEDLQDQMLNTFENVVLDNFELPPEIAGVSCSGMLPDEDIADESNKDVLYGTITVKVTFARDLI